MGSFDLEIAAMATMLSLRHKQLHRLKQLPLLPLMFFRTRGLTFLWTI